MPSAAKLKLVITADGRQARDELKGTGNSVLGLGKDVKKAGTDIKSIGKKMTGIGAGLDAAIGLAAAHAASFQEDTVALVHGAGESKDALAQVTQGLLDMAGQVGDTPDHLAQGMYLVESAGYHGAAGLEVMKAAAMGAKIGMADQATVADAVTSALNAYHLSASDANGVTGQLIQTVASGKMHMEDLAASLGMVLPAAASAHVSLQEVGAALATMTAQGTPAADAATYLRQTLLQLQNPTETAQGVLKELGFGTHDLANELNQKGLLATLTDLQEHLQKKFPAGGAAATAALAEVVGGTKSMQAALELTGSNLPVFAANIKNVGDRAAGAAKFEEDWALVQTTAAAQFANLKGQLDATVVSLGMALLPTLQQLMAIATPIITQISDFAKAHGDLVAKVLLGAAAFFTIAGTVLTFAGAITVALAVLNPVTLTVLAIIGVIAALGAAWATNFLGIRDVTGEVVGFVTTQWPLVQQTVETVMNAVQSVIQTVLGAVAPFVQSELNQITNWWINHHQQIQQVVEAVLHFIQQLWQVFGGTVIGIIQAYLQIEVALFEAAFQFIEQIVSTAWEIIKIVVDTYIHDVLDIITIVLDILTGNWGDAWATFQDLLKTTWDAMGQIVKDGVNLIIDFINDLIGAWNKINFSIPGFHTTIAGQAVNFDGVSINTPKLAPIPLLDSGGIVSGPTLAALAMNSVPEAVIPLNRDGGIIDYDRLAAAVARAVAGVSVEQYFYGSTDARAVQAASSGGLLSALRASGVA